MVDETLIAFVAGLLQGIFEWLPISSEGNIAIVLTSLGATPTAAVSFALFLHAGTAISAMTYYRGEIAKILLSVSELDLGRPFSQSTAVLSFLCVATLTSGVVGLLAYAALESLVSAVTGGLFVALIGILLIATGLLQRYARTTSLQPPRQPSVVDGVLIGALQGLAILPGVSRSGTTASVLLLRGYDGETSLRLSFLLSIPAALGGGLLGYLESGGLSGIGAVPAAIALGTAAIVGYVTIDALMRLVQRIDFWLVCVVLGCLAVLGGTLLL
ncbi:UDP-diphosphatase (plasmid) [Salinigranum rubrum]|uniref:Undecaprenyl-diphosphatase n=1 Tax=Salinigranum rubrum TaxID=755307 RepID=A0A2I8VQE5_9EURY|nr:undecaprenyl-diphosphate phosphatase [Salinigranum rubrum]AUV84147.1 UDP-diphosphatase [Salinigranum rubrum]